MVTEVDCRTKGFHDALTLLIDDCCLRYPGIGQVDHLYFNAVGAVDDSTRKDTSQRPTVAVRTSDLAADPRAIQCSAGFYTHDWLERHIGVHYFEDCHSATRIHPELQHLQVGDRIATGSIGNITVDAPVTVLEPNRALVTRTWAFMLQPTEEGHTRLLVR